MKVIKEQLSFSNKDRKSLTEAALRNWTYTEDEIFDVAYQLMDMGYLEGWEAADIKSALLYADHEQIGDAPYLFTMEEEDEDDYDESLHENMDNVTRALDTDLDAVSEIPLVMADAVEEDKKANEYVEKNIKQNDRVFLGASKQPTPKAIVEPKLPKLEESLFEDINESTVEVNESLDEALSPLARTSEKLADDLSEFLNRISGMAVIGGFLSKEDLKSLSETANILYDFAQMYETDKHPVEGIQEALSAKELSDLESLVYNKLADIMFEFRNTPDVTQDELQSAINNFTTKFFQTNESLDEEARLTTDGRVVVDDPHDQAYYDALDISDKDERKKVKEERRQEFLKIHGVEDYAGTEWDIDERGKNVEDQEADLYDRIIDEFTPDLAAGFKDITRTPEYGKIDRLDTDEISQDYDGNFILKVKKDSQINFLRDLAKAYHITMEEPKKYKDGFIVRLNTADIYDTLPTVAEWDELYNEAD